MPVLYFYTDVLTRALTLQKDAGVDKGGLICCYLCKPWHCKPFRSAAQRFRHTPPPPLLLPTVTV